MKLFKKVSFSLTAILIAAAILFSTSRVTKGIDPSFTFTTMGDLGANSRSDATLALMAAQSADLSFIVGDLSYSEITPESAWCDYVKSYLGASYPFEVLAGNHEDDDGPDGWIDNFAACLPDRLNSTGTYGKQYYADYPAAAPLARMIMISPGLPLDGENYDYSVGSPRYQWLSDTIDDARASNIPWVFVGMHKICLTIGTKTCGISQDLMNLLVEKKVDIAFQGHEHNYQRTKVLALGPNCTAIDTTNYNPDCVVDDTSSGLLTKGLGTMFVIVGSGGRGNYDIDPTSPLAGYFATWAGSSTSQVNGFNKVTVSANQLDFSFLPSVGTYTDGFTIVASGQTPGPTPTPVPSQTLSFASAADATVRESNPQTNYGAALNLEVDASSRKDYLLNFNVTGVTGSVLDAKLVLYNIDSSDSGGDYYATDSNWDEQTVTWDTAPALGNLVGSLGAVSSGGWYQVPLQNYITGDGQYSLRVISPSANGADYASREDANFAPYLLVTYEDSGATPSATPTPTPTPTPTATPTPSPTPSPTSTPTPTPTPTPTVPPTLYTFLPSDDAAIKQTSPDSNYGNNVNLEVDLNSLKDSLLKFQVSGLAGQTISSAKLRLYNIDSSNFGGDLRFTDTLWSESTLTWNTAPVIYPTVLGSLDRVSSNTWYEIDLTAFITGEGTYSFDMSSTSNNGADYSSKEGVNPPQLVITTN